MTAALATGCRTLLVALLLAGGAADDPVGLEDVSMPDEPPVEYDPNANPCDVPEDLGGGVEVVGGAGPLECPAGAGGEADA